MGMHLIADFSWTSASSWGSIAQMAIGLGVVIFVHELGHFLVAKLCGVKCEKFYVGFDVPMPKIGPWQIPSKLLHFQWGETEYGIGVIPLGGYVKMLGQDDNPMNAEAEAQRTKMQKEAGEGDQAVAEDAAQSSSGESSSARPSSAEPKQDHHRSLTDVDLEPAPLRDQVDYDIDPRSYTAKSVPQRMAIISAGVIMNVIFAVVFATIAYRIGVPYTPCYIGGTLPGSPAWKVDLPAGSQILQIGKQGEPREHLRFGQDFRQRVVLHGAASDLPLLLQHDGERKWVTIRPVLKDRGMGIGEIATVGVTSMFDTRIAPDRQVIEGFPAAKAETQLLAGDRIVAGIVDGSETRIDNYPDLHAFLAKNADRKVALRIERKLEPDKKDSPVESREVHLDRRPLRRLGIIMTTGPVTAVQQGSPAEDAGIREGDVLQALDGEPLDDPMVVPDQLRRRAGEEVTLTVLRNKKPLDLTVTPRPVRDHQSHVMPDEPVLVDALGLTFAVENRVTKVSPKSDAHGKIEPGDEITKFQLVAAGDTPEERQKNEEKLTDFRFSTREVSLVDGRHDWPAAFNYVQWIPPGTEVKLTYRSGESDDEKTVTVMPYDSPVDGGEAFYFPARGLVLDQLPATHTADSWSEAVYLGGRETWESLGLVLTFLRKLVSGGISPTSLGGPGTIAVAATSEASRGTSALLIFLTMLSANLAVINFLPIPVLDGGHMVFLAYEGIFRRPVNEKWYMRLTLLGLSFILRLMAFVIGLDIYRLTGLAQ